MHYALTYLGGVLTGLCSHSRPRGRHETACRSLVLLRWWPAPALHQRCLPMAKPVVPQLIWVVSYQRRYVTVTNCAESNLSPILVWHGTSAEPSRSRARATAAHILLSAGGALRWIAMHILTAPASFGHSDGWSVVVDPDRTVIAVIRRPPSAAAKSRHSNVAGCRTGIAGMPTSR
jgi:hypothetical protein